MLEFLFWLFALGSVFSYFIYPLILKVLPQPHRRDILSGDHEPPKPLFLSLIVTAYNEEARIREKIENTLKVRFDPTRLELIVASDCSDDKTDDIVREYADRGVRLVRAAEDHVLDGLRIDPAPCDEGADHLGREIVGPHPRERPAMPAHGGPHRIDDDGLTHPAPRPSPRSPRGRAGRAVPPRSRATSPGSAGP